AWAAPSAFAEAARVASLPPPGSAAALRALPGVGAERFADGTRRLFAASEYVVQPASDRMGLRLQGPPLPAERQGELLSHGVAPGAVQVPADGQPIVLAADCQPTGGYPVIAHVAKADLDLLAQLRPGDKLRFEPIGLEEALEAYRENERRHSQLAAAIRLRWFA
ncbi:allophanate hydrolase subunit 2 family protein, partial [Cohnella xylanilytica]|nr:allophanate hydrolase subunit 2 family protein [Cohnella xylanilytica]